MSARKIALNTAFLSIAACFGMLFSFFVILFISRFFGAAALGQYNFALSIAAFFSVFSGAGISTIIIRELAKQDCKKDFFSEMLGIKLALAVFSIALAIPVSIFFSSSEKAAEFVFLIVISFILDSFSLPFRNVFNARQEMHWEAIVFVSQKIAFAVIGFAFFLSGAGLFWVALALALSNVFSFALSLFIFFRLPNRPQLGISFSRSRLLFSAVVVPFVAIGFLDMASSKIDIFLVNFFLKSADALGLYSAPKTVFDALLVVELGFFAALFPRLSALFHSERKKMPATLSRLTKYLLVFSIPVVLISVFFSRQITVLIFGEAFSRASKVFAIYSISLLFMLLQSFLFNVLFIADRQKTTAKIFAATIAANIVLSFFLIPAFGIEGAAISGLFSFFACFILSLAEVRKFCGFGFPFLPRILIVSFFAFCLLFLLSLASENAFFPFSLPISPLVFLIFALDNEDWQFFKKKLLA